MPQESTQGSRYLRESRARKLYSCNLCSQTIPPLAKYFRDEPHPKARVHRGAAVKTYCELCILGDDAHATPTQDSLEQVTTGRQIALPFGERAIVVPTRAWVVDATKDLLAKLELDYSLIFEIGEERFETLIADRFEAMGLQVLKTGRANQRDGGIDLIVLPTTDSPLPFLGGVQVKHRRSPHKRTGPEEVRAFAGALQRHQIQMGFLVTNTTFTADATWCIKHQPQLLRLRDMVDLKRWISSRFLDQEEWREMPTTLELCPGLILDLTPLLRKPHRTVIRRRTGVDAS